MILWLLKRYAGVKPVVIDGILYVLIAVFGSLTGIFGSDETFKYVNVYFCWWTKTISEIGLAAASALKMFRSTSYSDHLADKAANLVPTQPSTTQQTKGDNAKDKQEGL